MVCGCHGWHRADCERLGSGQFDQPNQLPLSVSILASGLEHWRRALSCSEPQEDNALDHPPTTDPIS